MIVATFNANSVRARLETILKWLHEHEPDVLCLQETKAQDNDFPAVEFAAAGYQSSFRGEKSYNGVAVLSRSKPSAISFGFKDGGPADETRLVRADFGNVHVINTYVPQGRDIGHSMYRYKLQWFKRLRDYFESQFTGSMNVLWLGDFNVAPEHKDIHNADRQENHVCFHPDVRAALARTMSWGFVDVFRQLHPEGGRYTFFDYRTRDAVKRGMGWRVDHMMATMPLAKKCREIDIDLGPRMADKPSDHTFLYARFDV